MKRHHREVARIARQYGFTVQTGPKGHLHIIDADGRRVVTASSTPSNPDTALRRVASDLRKAGVR